MHINGALASVRVCACFQFRHETYTTTNDGRKMTSGVSWQPNNEYSVQSTSRNMLLYLWPLNPDCHDVWARRMLIGLWCTVWCPQRGRDGRWESYREMARGGAADVQVEEVYGNSILWIHDSDKALCSDSFSLILLFIKTTSCAFSV